MTTPLLHRTNTYLCLLPLEHANPAAGRELMDGRRPAAEAMLLFFLQSLKSGSVVSLFPLSHCLPLYCKRLCPNLIFISVRSYGSKPSQGFNKHLMRVVASKLFFFFSSLSPAAVPLHCSHHQTIHSPVKQSAPLAFPVGKYSPFPHSFLFSLWGLYSCWCLWS